MNEELFKFEIIPNFNVKMSQRQQNNVTQLEREMFQQNTSSKYKFVLLTNQIRRPNSGTKHQTIVKFFEIF